MIAWDVGQYQPVLRIHGRECRQQAPVVCQRNVVGLVATEQRNVIAVTEPWWDS